MSKNENQFSDIKMDISSNSGSSVMSIEDLLEDKDLEVLKKDEDNLEIGNEPEKEIKSGEVEVEIEGEPEKESDEPEPSEDVVVEDNPKTKAIDYKKVMSKLVDDGIWEDVDAFEDEDGNELTLDEVDIDEETFVDIVKQKQEQLKEKLSSGKVSTEGISDFTKRLIDIEKKGGNVKQAIEAYEAYKNPLEALDMSSDIDLQKAVYMRLNASNVDEKDILRIIKSYKDEGILEEKGLEAKSDLEKAYNEHLKMIEKDADDKRAEEAEFLKEYKSKISEELKGYGLEDKYRAKLVSIATKKSQEGGNFQLDEMYSDMRKDPEKAAELALFLYDKKAYIEYITKGEKVKDAVKTMSKLKLIPRGSKSKVKIKDDKKDTGLIDVDGLF